MGLSFNETLGQYLVIQRDLLALATGLYTRIGTSLGIWLELQNPNPPLLPHPSVPVHQNLHFDNIHRDIVQSFQDNWS